VRTQFLESPTPTHISEIAEQRYGSNSNQNSNSNPYNFNTNGQQNTKLQRGKANNKGLDQSSSGLNNVFVGATSSLWNSQDHHSSSSSSISSRGRDHHQQQQQNHGKLGHPLFSNPRGWGIGHLSHSSFSN